MPHLTKHEMEEVLLASAAAAITDTDCVVVGLAGDMSPRFIGTARQQGVTVPMVLSGTVHSAVTIAEQIGEDVEGVYVGTGSDHSSEGFQELEAAVAAAYPGEPQNVTDMTAQAWIGVHIFADGELVPAGDGGDLMVLG